MPRPPIIDTHQHFWQIEQFPYAWMTDDLAPLRRDMLPEHLAIELAACAVAGTVTVQADQCVEETRFLLQLADQYEFVMGVVGWVDLTDPDVGRVLDDLSANAKLKGIRHVVHDEPETEWLVREDVLRGLREVARRGLAYDLLLRPQHLPLIEPVAKACPQLRLIIDHIAKPPIASGRLQPWADHIRRAARIEGLHCKLSGMITEADWENWEVRDLKPYAEVVIDAFGPERLTFGSDWPVCMLAGSYGEVYHAFCELIGSLSTHEQEQVRQLNAWQFYKLAR